MEQFLRGQSIGDSCVKMEQFLRWFGSSSWLSVVAHLFLLFLLLLVFLFFLFLLLLSARRSLSRSLVLIVRGLGISRLLAGPLSEPLGQLGLGPLAPVVHLFLPGFLQQLRIQHIPAALIELPSVLICSCVCPPLVFGVHADFGRVLAREGLGVETKLNGFLLVLLPLPLFQLFQVIVLSLLPLFQVILLSLKPHDHLPQLAGLLLQGVPVHPVQLEGLDPDAQRDLFLLLQLLLCLCHLPSRILHVPHAASVGLLGASLLVASGLLFLLDAHPSCPLLLSLLQPLPLLLRLLCLLLCLLFP